MLVVVSAVVLVLYALQIFLLVMIHLLILTYIVQRSTTNFLPCLPSYVFACSLLSFSLIVDVHNAHLLIHSLTLSLTQSPLTHALTHSLAQSLNPSLTSLGECFWRVQLAGSPRSHGAGRAAARGNSEYPRSVRPAYPDHLLHRGYRLRDALALSGHPWCYCHQSGWS
jgi:hypothetical protein